MFKPIFVCNFPIKSFFFSSFSGSPLIYLVTGFIFTFIDSFFYSASLIVGIGGIARGLSFIWSPPGVVTTGVGSYHKLELFVVPYAIFFNWTIRSSFMLLVLSLVTGTTLFFLLLLALLFLPFDYLFLLYKSGKVAWLCLAVVLIFCKKLVILFWVLPNEFGVAIFIVFLDFDF